MSLVKIQFGKMESTIVQQGNTIAMLQKENEELRRRLGISGAATKPTRTTRVRAHNKATVN